VNGHISGTRGPTKCDKFLFDFSVLGGTQVAKTLTDLDGTAATIPDNACILRAYVEGITTGASLGSATIKLGITGNDDLFIGATAMDHATFTADLTAAKFVVHVEYTVGS
jgi:hypothetical protein